MSLQAQDPCPDGHTVYLSQMLADNAVTLHRIRDAHCPAYSAFPHGDHWHVGHPSKGDGDICKAASVRVWRPRR